MELRELEDKHAGQNFIVCGCGESVTQLTDRTGVVTIGVNDIERLFIPDYLVVINDKVGFNPDRWKWIENARCPVVLTHLRSLPIKNEAAKVVFPLGRYAACELDKPAVDYTNNSPWLAVVLAYKMGAKNIGLIGVDFTPNHFFAKTGDHPLSRTFKNINAEYAKLRDALSKKGVTLYNLSLASRLDLPKIHIDDFRKL